MLCEDPGRIHLAAPDNKETQEALRAGPKPHKHQISVLHGTQGLDPQPTLSLGLCLWDRRQSTTVGNDCDLGEAWEAQDESRDTGTPLSLGNYLLLYTKLRALRSDDQSSHKRGYAKPPGQKCRPLCAASILDG